MHTPCHALGLWSGSSFSHLFHFFDQLRSIALAWHLRSFFVACVSAFASNGSWQHVLVVCQPIPQHRHLCNNALDLAHFLSSRTLTTTQVMVVGFKLINRQTDRQRCGGVLRGSWLGGTHLCQLRINKTGKRREVGKINAIATRFCRSPTIINSIRNRGVKDRTEEKCKKDRLIDLFAEL